MPPPIKVLLVDDKEDYCKSLSGPARHYNLQIAYCLDWETGFEYLQKNPSIEFVILDGKGKAEADQEVEHESFALKAIQEIQEYGNKQKKKIPFCLNTGFVDSFSVFEGNMVIFEKNDAERDKMFKHIISEVEDSKYRTLRMPYDEVFKTFDMQIVSKVHEHLLLDIIKTYTDKDYSKKNIALQRDLLEAIFKSLNNPIPCIPDSFFDNRKNGKPNLEWATQFLENRPTGPNRNDRLNIQIPPDIKAAFRKITESSNKLSHLTDEDAKLPFLSNTFLLMEILSWLPEFVEKNYKNYI